MGLNSSIEWTDATWNPVTGCSVVSPGCTNCYAMKLAGTRLQHHPSRAGLTTPSKAGPVWNGQVRLNTDWLTQPLTWKRPRRIFVCAHGDLFHESVPDAWIDKVFAVMALAPQHTFQVLTKRAERMQAYLTRLDTEPALETARRIAAAWPTANPEVPKAGITFPLPNVWLGVSAEDQARADERIPHLLATPAAVRFLSAEPLLGPIDLLSADHGDDVLNRECWGDCANCKLGRPPCRNCRVARNESDWVAGLDWVIAGGESGPGARPMHPDWVRQIRDDCEAAGVAFFFKQWGEWAPETDAGLKQGDPAMVARGNGQFAQTAREIGPAEVVEIVGRIGKKAAGRLLDGRTHDAMPGLR